jgi:glycosyltransferase involved in cell wall biosynthesis
MPESEPETACIIPAFNEDQTVAEVARIASTHPLVSEVVVIDDGSDDSTADNARSVDGVDVIQLETNSGKGAAMHAGMLATDEPILLFLDADLIGITAEHITDLLEPVISNEADMTVGLFRGGRLHTDLAHIVTPSLSGQRAVKREVLDGLDMDSVGFGIERALTELWETEKIRVREVILHGVTHRTKEEKRGYLPGVRQRMEMYFDILKYEGDRLKRRINGKLSDSERDRNGEGED